MKNITLAIDEEVLAKVRRIAAEKDTTINAMVREFRTHMAERHARANNAREKLKELSETSTWSLGELKWSRKLVYGGDT